MTTPNLISRIALRPRKSQHEVMQSLRKQLDEEAWQRLNDYISSVVQMVKDTNDTREERLLAENERLKRELAEQEKQHREELERVKRKKNKGDRRI
jgi:hypothetical protein